MKYLFPKGHKINLGRKWSKEVIEKRVSKFRGKKRGPLSEEHRRQISKTLTGKKQSEETKRKRSISLKNAYKNPEAITRLSESHKREKSYLWKGNINNIGYRAKHYRIQTILGKAKFCSFDSTHISNRFHWANISSSYLENKNDWISLCPKCHKQYDVVRSGRVYL